MILSLLIAAELETQPHPTELLSTHTPSPCSPSPLDSKLMELQIQICSISIHHDVLWEKHTKLRRAHSNLQRKYWRNLRRTKNLHRILSTDVRHLKCSVRGMGLVLERLDSPKEKKVQSSGKGKRRVK